MEQRQWSVAVRIFVAVAGLLAACAAGYFAGLVGGFAACRGSPAFGNGGVSEAWVCREMSRTLLNAIEELLFVTALLAPLIGGAIAARASRVIWFVVGLTVGATAVVLQILVNEGQVSVLS